MKMVITILVQFIIGLIGTMGVYFGGIGNGWELVAFPIVYALGFWLVGLVLDRLWRNDDVSWSKRVVGTLIGGAIGASILMIPGAWGFQGILFPLIGAILGYQLGDRL